MSYTINELSILSGVSVRTLHYYDEMNLLKAKRLENGYREYSEESVDRLQQILLYKELDVKLSEIKKILDSPEYNVEKSLSKHLLELKEKQQRTKKLIENVEKTILNLKGTIIMSNEEKFEGLKRAKLTENEERYGKELREKYGDKAIDEANEKFLKRTEKEYNDIMGMENEIKEALAAAMEAGDYRGEAAKKLFELHKEWLQKSWKTYSKQAHAQLAQTYLYDERFKAYYDEVKEGGAEFLVNTIKAFCE